MNASLKSGPCPPPSHVALTEQVNAICKKRKQVGRKRRVKHNKLNEAKTGTVCTKLYIVTKHNIIIYTCNYNTFRAV